MARGLTEQEKQKIKESVVASCVSKGIKPTVMSGGQTVANPMYTSCVQLGYADAVREASKGKLGLWFSKVNSFVQSQGGLTGMFQSISSIANQYKTGTPDLTDSQSTVPSDYPGYVSSKEKGGMTGLWLIIVILLIVLVIASVLYFNKSKNA
jgi:hypothetical protein